MQSQTQGITGIAIPDLREPETYFQWKYEESWLLVRFKDDDSSGMLRRIVW
jgi:hypothetical protein